MVRARTFREDLFYRLSVVTVVLPPLRERDNDVLLLAEHFLERYGEQFSKPLAGFSGEAACALAGYTWPGNVRELQNVVQRAVILAGGRQIELPDLPSHVVIGEAPRAPKRAAASRPDAAPVHAALAEIDDDAERIRRALELAGGNRERAASLLGIGRTTLWRRIKALGIDL